MQDAQRSGFTWWLIVLLVLGCLLAAAVPIDLFMQGHLATVGHGTVDCGSIVFPQAHEEAVSSTGNTCGNDHARLLTGVIVIFVVSVALIATTFLVRRARVRRH
jgi:hypothetical protein